ncbi:hypothetical protein [Amycolatopsis nigrescens]|uniref:hypothetical protein n=1 Tax=Amycolatopsis nigrescens TaxID=381445 RepID=UPI0003682A25|nr:hypothetical protein [Amycolatopsis nigrescens]
MSSTEYRPDSVWVVIAPSGELTWYTAAEERLVDRLVGGFYGPEVTATSVVDPRHRPALRVMGPDRGRIAPEHYPLNPAARQVITLLSGGRFRQDWRGHIALVELTAALAPGPMPAGIANEIATALESPPDS